MKGNDSENISIEYGENELISIPTKGNYKIELIKSNSTLSPIEDIKLSLENVLKHPVGIEKSFLDLANEYVSASSPLLIIVDDNSRPNFHTKILLPLFLDFLEENNISNFLISIATGTHKRPSDESIKNKIFGTELYHRIQDHITVHDCDNNLEYFGTTSFNTPIYLDKIILKSKLIVPITDSEYHWFAGQAGTVKSFCPGLAGRLTVRNNHTMMFDYERGIKRSVGLAKTENNPVISDMKEIVQKLSNQFEIFCIDSVVANDSIMYLNAGNILDLHEAAKPILKDLNVIQVDKKADIVIVTSKAQGINLYQTGKAFHCGWNAVKHGGKGKLIVLSSCSEEVGNDAYYRVMKETSQMSIKDALKYTIDNYCSIETFEIGNQKTVDLLRITQDIGEGNLFILTKMDCSILKPIFRIEGIPFNINSASRELHKIITQQSELLKKQLLIYIILDPNLLIQQKG